MARSTLHVWLASVLVLFACPAAPGADIVSTWLGGSGDWTDPARWDTADYPHNNGSTYEALIESGIYSHVTLDDDVTIDGFTIGFGETLAIHNGCDLTLAEGIPARAITNRGTLSMESTGSTTYLNFYGEVTLTGSGSVTLSDSDRNRIVGWGDAPHLVNEGNYIHGAGHIGEAYHIGEETAVTNAGVIEADQSTELVVKARAGGTNTGDLRAAAGGTLVLDGGAWANAGGRIRAEDASTVELTSHAVVTGGEIYAADGALVDLAYDATVAGATLATAGTGAVRVTEDATLDGTAVPVTNEGTFEVADDASAVLKGVFANSGTLALAAGTNVTHLDLDGEVTLSGGGTVTLSDSENNRMLGAGTAPHLVNQDNTIRGAGYIGQAWATGEETQVTNAGLIEAAGATDLVVKAVAGGTNTGTLRADAGTLLIESGAWANGGGVIEALDASTVQINGGATVTGGTLRATGTGLVRADEDGTVTATSADPLTVDVAELGSVVFDGTLDLADGGLLTKTGAGTLVIAGPQQHGPGAALHVLAGVVEFNSDVSGTGSIDDAHLSVEVSGGEVRMGCNQHLDTLEIGAGGLVRFAGANTVVVRHLVLNGMDLGAMTLTPEPATLALLAAGGLALAARRRQ